MSSDFSLAPVPPSDELDLVALFQAAWQQRKLVLILTATVGLIAAAYAFLVTPEYQVSSVLRPAAINELDALNRTQIYQLSPGEALNKVGASLESYDTRLGFFRANQALFKRFVQPGQTLEQSFEDFNRASLNVTLPNAQKSNLLTSYIQIQLKYPRDIDGVAILNGLVAYAIDKERRHVAGDLEVIIKNRLNELKGKYDAAKASYEAEKEGKITRLVEGDELRRAQLQDELKALYVQLKALRNDRIAQLTEAIDIARSLGIWKPTTPSSLGSTGGAAGNTLMRTEINNQQPPLYFMGVDALDAERKALRQRTSDAFTDARVTQIAKELLLLQKNREIEVLNERKKEDLFFTDVQPLRAEIVRLSSLNVDMSRLKLVTIDQQALEPLSPVEPKRLLVIVSGLLLGLFIGVVFVLGRHAITSRTLRSSSRSLASSYPSERVLVLEEK